MFGLNLYSINSKKASFEHGVLQPFLRKAATGTGLQKLMRKDAFVEESSVYKGTADAKHSPPIPTPPKSTRKLEQVLESEFAPKAVGIQTVPSLL